MYFQSLHLMAIACFTLVPFTQCSSVVRAQRPSLGPLSSTISNEGKPLTVLRSDIIPEFYISPIWTSYEEPPSWFRPVDFGNVTVLVDALSDVYSPRPPNEVAKYTTVGPESSASFANFSTRVTVKDGAARRYKSSCPKAPMRNKEIVETARMLKLRYEKEWAEPTEWGWQMMYIEIGASHAKNCTGVILIQRDLWYEGAENIQTQPAATA